MKLAFDICLYLHAKNKQNEWRGNHTGQLVIKDAPRRFFNLNRHGMGHYYLPDGTMKTGLWEDGKRMAWLDEL